MLIQLSRELIQALVSDNDKIAISEDLVEVAVIANGCGA